MSEQVNPTQEDQEIVVDDSSQDSVTEAVSGNTTESSELGDYDANEIESDSKTSEDGLEAPENMQESTDETDGAANETRSQRLTQNRQSGDNRQRDGRQRDNRRDNRQRDGRQQRDNRQRDQRDNQGGKPPASGIGPHEYEPVIQYGRSRRIRIRVTLEDITYKNVPLLARFIDPYGRIYSRRKTGASAKIQRRVVREIKRARHLALLPYTGDHTRMSRLKRRR